MPSLFQNKFVRYGLIGFGGIIILFVLLVILWAITNTLSMSTGLGGVTLNSPGGGGYYDSVGITSAPTYERAQVTTDSYRPGPTPNPQGYTSGLETYETTTYNVGGRTKEFDSFCATLSTLKTDPDIHFKHLDTSTNSCRATFYATADKAAGTLATLKQYDDVEFTRNTISVTRHKQRIESQTDILKQQLASVERLLTKAETEFDEIANFARDSKNARTYSEAIQEKLKLVDQLTQRKISYTSQLNDLYQQAADLSERIDVVEFSVNVQRLHSIYPNKTEREWLNAWNEMKEQFTEALIGMTTVFAIFLIRALQFVLYLLVVIVILRGLWKFGKFIWNRW